MTLSSSRSFPELRIVLLGPKNAEKSSAGNTILGKKEFDVKKTLHCKTARAEISGTRITVVDTPGWWGNLPFDENPELYKQEIILSVTKCPPGPHVLLLVLNVDTPFEQSEKKILCDNMKHFGEEVWNYTMMILTCGDQAGDLTTRVLENENLQWLVEKCGNRYHKLNNNNQGDGSQVTELLEKIQKMVEENGGRHYEINSESNILQQMEEKRREQEKRAEERRMKNQQMKDKTRDENHLSELRIILLGYHKAGKRSIGNTILGRPAFDPKRSLKSVIREGDVAGRHVTVVDTPGRRRHYCSKCTPKIYKDEIVLSSSHCPPGPHVFLLVIRVDVSFSKMYRRAVEEHVPYLGLNIWDHMIVLFTFGDWLRDTSIELFIESEGEALQWIIDRCGNRYHVFNNRNTDDDSQVKELFEKIEEMVAGNEGRCFMIDNGKLQEVTERRMKIEKRTKQMQNEELKRKEVRQSKSGIAGLSEMKLVLLGPHYSGKSLTGNTILQRQAFDKRIEENVVGNGEVAGRKLSVVYTPGFEKDYLTGEKLDDAKRNILRSATECSSGIHAFIFVQSVDSSFAEEEKSTLEKIMEPLGEGVWNHMLVVFTVGDEPEDTPIEFFITSEGDALQWLIEKCGNRYHVLNNKDWGDGSQVAELIDTIEEMVAGNGGLYQVHQETLQRVISKSAEGIKRKNSMDTPLTMTERKCPSLVSSSAYVSQSTEEKLEEHSFKKSVLSDESSVLKSITCDPESN